MSTRTYQCESGAPDDFIKVDCFEGALKGSVGISTQSCGSFAYVRLSNENARRLRDQLNEMLRKGKERETE